MAGVEIEATIIFRRKLNAKITFYLCKNTNES